jgi:hypothetical protein
MLCCIFIVVEKKVRDEEKLRKRFSLQFGGWLLKVSAKDRNMQNIGKLPEDIDAQE